jgi:hypothetical protein
MSQEMHPHIDPVDVLQEQALLEAQRAASVLESQAALQPHGLTALAEADALTSATPATPVEIHPNIHLAEEDALAPAQQHSVIEESHDNTTAYILDIGVVPELDEEQAYQLWQEEAGLEATFVTEHVPHTPAPHIDKTKNAVAVGVPVQLPLTYHTEEHLLPLEPVHKVNPVRKKSKRK